MVARVALAVVLGIFPAIVYATTSMAASVESQDKADGESGEKPQDGKRDRLLKPLPVTPESRKRLQEISAANGTNPTGIVGFYQLSYEHDSFTTPSRLDVARTVVQLPLTPSFLMRVVMPYLWSDPNRPGTSSENGVGDLSFRIGWRVYTSPYVALFAGADAVFPTASNKVLGLEKYAIGPAVAAAVPMPRLRSLLFVLVQDARSIGGNPSRPDLHFGRIQTVVNTIWSERWWTTLELVANANWELNGKSGGTLETELGHRFDDHWRMFIRPGVGLWGKSIPQAYDWNIEVGVRWIFTTPLIPKRYFEWFSGE